MAPNDRKLDVLIVGPYPPPLGGVSTHVQRLARLLARHGLQIGVLSHFRHHSNDPVVIGSLHRNPLLYWLAVRRSPARIVHYHYAGFANLLPVALTRRRQRAATYVITIHVHGLQRHLESRVLSRVTRWALNRFDEIIAVSPEIADTLQGHLVRPITTLPAFLPLDQSGQRDGLSQSADDFLQRPGPTLVVSAYRVIPQRGNGDLYGLDIAAEVFARLARRYADLRLAIFLARPPHRLSARRYPYALNTRLAEQGLSSRAAVYEEMSLVPAFAYDVVYLRPSRIDGDAVGVREALDAGVSVLASDVVARPNGAHVVPTTDVTAWCESLEQLFERPASKPSLPGPDSSAGSPVYAQSILELYARHLPLDVSRRLRPVQHS